MQVILQHARVAKALAGYTDQPAPPQQAQVAQSNALPAEQVHLHLTVAVTCCTCSQLVCICSLATCTGQDAPHLQQVAAHAVSQGTWYVGEGAEDFCFAHSM